MVRAKTLMHGKAHQVEHDGRTLFQDVAAIAATRYHSLIVAEKTLPKEELEVSAWTTEADGTRVIMGLRHRTEPVEGVQFHPESVLTTEGRKMLKNFLSL